MCVLALPAAEHARAPPVHCARLGPGRAPWRVLRVFKVERAGAISRDLFPPCRAAQGHGNSQIQTLSVSLCCCSVYHTDLSVKCCCGSHGTTSVALPTFFDSYGRCLRVRRFFVLLYRRNKSGEIGFAFGIPRMPRGTRENLNSSGFLEQPRNYSSSTPYNSSRALNYTGTWYTL